MWTTQIRVRRFLNLYNQAVILCTMRLKIKKKKIYVLPTQCIVCCVKVSEQTGNISVHSTKWFVVITGTECVISGFGSGVYEKCALLGHYAACSGNSLSIVCVHSAELTKSLNNFSLTFVFKRPNNKNKTMTFKIINTIHTCNATLLLQDGREYEYWRDVGNYTHSHLLRSTHVPTPWDSYMIKRNEPKAS